MSNLKLIPDDAKTPRTARSILFEIRCAVDEIENHVNAVGWLNTGEDWVLTQLQEIEKKLTEALKKV